MTKTATKTKTSPKKVAKYLRLPLDQNILNLIASVQLENPFFNELDVLRYILGKYVAQNQDSFNRGKLLNWFDANVGQKDLPKMSEDEIFKTLAQNNLDR